MAKLSKRDFIHLAVLTAFYLILVLILTRFKYVYGSTIDWQEQAWSFPEYFRMLFYKNHDIFPDFALNIGAGQNIYNFSYYGFLSPVTLLSYLFPFVKMADFIVITSILSVVASTVLFYIWLKRGGHSSLVCFVVSLLFLCAGPLIFQSHRQLMFMNYFPFLMLGFIGIDRYFEKKKSLLLIIGTFLMIMTSYYFSVGGIIALFVYGIYKQMKESDATFKSFVLSMIKLAFPVILGVLLSGVLLLPTFAALLNGRNTTDSRESISILSLLLPKISLQNILYSPYSLGLTSIAVIAIISGFLSKKREKIILSAILSAVLLFPIFMYVLNGTLYLRAKALIPFLPLICLVTAHFIEDLFENRPKKKMLVVVPILAFAAVFSLKWEYNLLFIIDSAVTILAIVFFSKTGKKLLVCIPVAVICVLSCFAVNLNDELFLVSDQKVLASRETESLVQEVIDTDKSFYRFSNELHPLENVNKIFSADYYQTTLYSSIYNKGYNDFYFNIFNNEINFRNSVITNSTKNVLFNLLMGNKYVLTSQPPPAGYEFVETNGKESIYKNDSVFPLGYATSRLLSESTFDTLGYPYTDEALLNYAVVNTPDSAEYSTEIKPVSPEIASMDTKNLTFREENGTYFIKADDKATMTLQLKEALKGKVIFLRFHMDKQSKTKDTYIFINNIKNKLTCQNWEYQNKNFVFDYALSSNDPIEKLDIVFKKGDYQISGIETYALDYQNMANILKTIDPFEVDMEKTGGDRIAGEINVTKDGYFVLNIPYDKGFTIRVDGKETAYEKVNKAFIGFKVTQGQKKIEITYHSPLKTAGIAMSLLGIALAGAVVLFERRRKKTSL